MSPSNEPPPAKKRRGCLWTICAIVATIIVVLAAGRGCNAYNHAAHRREATQLGTQLVEELNSYGPLEPAEGDLSQGGRDTLFREDTDPSRYYTYTASAHYAVDSPAPGNKTGHQAYEAVVNSLVDDGWTISRQEELSTETTGDITTYSEASGDITILRRGLWSARVFYYLDEIRGTTVRPGTVRARFTSPNAGGFVLPRLFSSPPHGDTSTWSTQEVLAAPPPTPARATSVPPTSLP